MSCTWTADVVANLDRSEAEVDPQTVTICHCTDCQVLTGSVYRVTVPARNETFKLISGSPKYVKTAESGTKRAHAFCPDCGTPIYATSVSDQQVYGLRVGTLQQRSQLAPKKQAWCRSASGLGDEYRTAAAESEAASALN